MEAETPVALRLPALAAAVRAMSTDAMKTMNDHAILNEGGISPDVRLAVGRAGEIALLNAGYGGHCLDAIMDAQSDPDPVLACRDDELPVIKHLHTAWRDRALPASLIRTTDIHDRLDAMPETRRIIDRCGGSERSVVIADIIVDLVGAAMRDMGMTEEDGLEDPAKVWSAPMEYALVLHRTPDRNGSRLLCRGDGGIEFIHYQPTEEAAWMRLTVGSRILVHWQGRTANHPGYRHRVLCPDSVKVHVRQGKARARRETFVDVPLDARVVMARDTRDAPKGAIGTVSGYGDGTCRVVLDESFREVSARADCIVRKRRPRGGNRRIETHSIL